MSKWNEPVTEDQIIVLIFALGIFCMVAVPLAFVIAALAGLVGLGGTQDMHTIIGSFAIVAMLGIAVFAVIASRVG